MASVDCTEGKFNISLNPLKIVGCDNNFTRSDCKRGGLRLDEWNSSRRELELDELLLTVSAVIINLFGVIVIWWSMNKRRFSLGSIYHFLACAHQFRNFVVHSGCISLDSSTAGRGTGPDLAHARNCIYL